jgi:predicted DsbA family dithiol-disulfide isomerase
MNSESPEAITIDVVSDVVCPWCYIGKRQLEQAIAQWQAAHPQAPAPTVNWHPFQLNPDMPGEGIARADYLQRKFGRSDVGRIYDNVKRAAGEVGLPLNIEAIDRQPNTLRPHALLAAAADAGCQPQMAEVLFNGYFIEGRDLCDTGTLAELGRSAGLDEARLQAALNDTDLHAAVSDQDQQAREGGISGVPYFIFNNRFAVSGAQGADRLLRALDRLSTR